MSKLKLFISTCLIFVVIFSMTGCKQDNMDGGEIVVTNYPNEYITDKLFGKHSTITSIYPDGVDINEYKVTKKQKLDYSSKNLFIYNGLLEKERDLAMELLDLNSELKIIDSAYVLETDYSPEELWLNPNSLLMMAQNIRLGLKEYITSSYLQKEINSSYNKLKVTLSELDADFRLTVDNTKNKVIVVNDSSLKYLEKFGLTVICLDDDITEKQISDVQEMIDEGTINYIFNFEGEKNTSTTDKLLDNNTNIKLLKFHKLDNLTDEERDQGKTYVSVMKDNLETLKDELYQ